jgi:diguanylate cyclase (GGDEF)-like protein
MAFVTIHDLDNADLDRNPVRIAERIWWVGHRQHDDAFQCHVYLIEQGKQSVLLDPGSKLTFRHTLRKVEEIIPFSFIRYFICHHQDPDIAGAMPVIDELVSRDDAVLVTHGRAKALLRHYGMRLPFWLVEEHEWRLELEDRELNFVFTPYAHFPGAFCSFDRRTRVLFSSDLFGGFTPEFSLVARDERYFEALRPFHEHYMPSREILGYALKQIAAHPVRMIAPQHGSVIPEHLVEYMIRRLKDVDCGLYLSGGDTRDIERLSRLNQSLHDITRTLIVSRDFEKVASGILHAVQRLLPAQSLEFFAWLGDDEVLHLGPQSRYHGRMAEPPAAVAQAASVDRQHWLEPQERSYRQVRLKKNDRDDGAAIVLPLFPQDGGTAHAVALIRLREDVAPSPDIDQVIDRMTIPLQVAVERATIHRVLDMERQRFYERSIRDPLTGLFTRFYMEDMVRRNLDLHDRDDSATTAMAMIDIDHFKQVNDTFGHTQGDEVLRLVARVVRNTARGGDLPVRLGGDELAIFVTGRSATNIGGLAERVRLRVADIAFDAPMQDRMVTVSVGTAMRKRGEPLSDFIQRADRALYEAKRGGRNRVCQAP